MIKAFRHKGLETFFQTGSKAGYTAAPCRKAAGDADTLDSAKRPDDMNAPGWRLHPLSGELAGHYSVTVNGNWRMAFTFDGENAELVDYLDYH